MNNEHSKLPIHVGNKSSKTRRRYEVDTLSSAKISGCLLTSDNFSAPEFV